MNMVTSLSVECTSLAALPSNRLGVHAEGLENRFLEIVGESKLGGLANMFSDHFITRVRIHTLSLRADECGRAIKTVTTGMKVDVGVCNRADRSSSRVTSRLP